MERLADRTRSLGALVLAACLPTLLALAAIAALHLGREGRLRTELEQRATLIATALAEASEYGLISGNPAALDRSMRGLIDHDPAIAAIDVTDAARHAFVSLSGTTRQADLVAVEMPVRSSVPDIDFFDRATPHVSTSDDVQPTFRLGPVVGYVRVTLSSAPLLAERRQAWWEEMLAVGLAGLAGVAVVVVMARRVGATVGGVLEGLRALLEGRHDVPEGAPAAGDLGRVQRAVLSLAEELAARRRDGARAPAAGATSVRAPSTQAGAGEGTDAASTDRLERRIVGRVDAALLALRLAGRHAARQARVAATDEERQRVNEIALRVLDIADQANAAGSAVLDPMRHHIVEGAGLDAALDDLLRACAHAHPACLLDVTDGADLSGVHAIQGVRLHRTVQDAMTQLMAFSDASEAAIRIENSPDSPTVRVIITDNGEGEDSNAAAARLARLRDDVAACGGQIEVTRSPVRGTTVVLTVPASPPA